jgi:hypothetical protein
MKKPEINIISEQSTFVIFCHAPVNCKKAKVLTKNDSSNCCRNINSSLFKKFKFFSKKFLNVYIIHNNAKFYIYWLHILCFNIAYRNLHKIIGFFYSKAGSATSWKNS